MIYNKIKCMTLVISIFKWLCSNTFMSVMVDSIQNKRNSAPMKHKSCRKLVFKIHIHHFTHYF